MINTDKGSTIAFSRVGPSKFVCPTCYFVCKSITDVLFHLFCEEELENDSIDLSNRKNASLSENKSMEHENIVDIYSNNYNFLLTSNYDPNFKNEFDKDNREKEQYSLHTHSKNNDSVKECFKETIKINDNFFTKSFHLKSKDASNYDASNSYNKKSLESFDTKFDPESRRWSVTERFRDQYPRFYYPSNEFKRIYYDNIAPADRALSFPVEDPIIEAEDYGTTDLYKFPNTNDDHQTDASNDVINGIAREIDEEIAAPEINSQKQLLLQQNALFSRATKRSLCPPSQLSLGPSTAVGRSYSQQLSPPTGLVIKRIRLTLPQRPSVQEHEPGRVQVAPPPSTATATSSNISANTASLSDVSTNTASPSITDPVPTIVFPPRLLQVTFNGLVTNEQLNAQQPRPLSQPSSLTTSAAESSIPRNNYETRSLREIFTFVMSRYLRSHRTMNTLFDKLQSIPAGQYILLNDLMRAVTTNERPCSEVRIQIAQSLQDARLIRFTTIRNSTRIQKGPLFFQ